MFNLFGLLIYFQGWKNIGRNKKGKRDRKIMDTKRYEYKLREIKKISALICFVASLGGCSLSGFDTGGHFRNLRICGNIFLTLD